MTATKAKTTQPRIIVFHLVEMTRTKTKSTKTIKTTTKTTTTTNTITKTTTATKAKTTKPRIIVIHLVEMTTTKTKSTTTINTTTTNENNDKDHYNDKYNNKDNDSDKGKNNETQDNSFPTCRDDIFQSVFEEKEKNCLGFSGHVVDDAEDKWGAPNHKERNNGVQGLPGVFWQVDPR